MSATHSALRLCTVEYDAGLQLRSHHGWGAVTQDRFGAPTAVIITQDREASESSESLQIPWRRVVSLTDHGAMP